MGHGSKEDFQVMGWGWNLSAASRRPQEWSLANGLGPTTYMGPYDDVPWEKRIFFTKYSKILNCYHATQRVF